MLKAALERDTLSRPFEKEIKKFGELVLSEPEILTQLEKTSDSESFISTYCQLAANKDIHFTPAELRIVVQEQKQGSNWVIPKVVLSLIRERF